MKVLRVAAFSVALVPAAVFAQTSSDPFEARFRQRSNFQIRFKVPEKGGELLAFEDGQSKVEESDASEFEFGNDNALMLRYHGSR